MMMQRKAPLHVYGPPGSRQIIEALATACDVPCEIGFGVAGQQLPHPRDFVKVQEIVPGSVIDIGPVRVSCCENTHYRSEDEHGSDGPLSLALRFDTPDRTIVFTADTGPCRALEAFARDADLLVGERMDIEATVSVVRQQNPHMTAEHLAMMGRHLFCSGSQTATHELIIARNPPYTFGRS